MRDLLVDIDPLMSWFPNPVKSIAVLIDQAEHIGIHSGFAGMNSIVCFVSMFPFVGNTSAIVAMSEDSILTHSGFLLAYMNGKSKHLGEGKTKKIRERVIELVKEHPNYVIYCTGHSLGKPEISKGRCKRSVSLRGIST